MLRMGVPRLGERGDARDESARDGGQGCQDMRTECRRSGFQGRGAQDGGSRATHVGVGAERARPARLGGACGCPLLAGSEAEQEAAQGPALQRHPGSGTGRSSGPEQRQQSRGPQRQQRRHRRYRQYRRHRGCGARGAERGVRSPERCGTRSDAGLGVGLVPAAPKPRLGADPRRVRGWIAVISERGLSTSGKLHLLFLADYALQGKLRQLSWRDTRGNPPVMRCRKMWSRKTALFPEPLNSLLQISV